MRRRVGTPGMAGIGMVSAFGPGGVNGAVGGAGNGLLNNLIAYWPGNEAAGNALDLHVNALTLTDVNTVTSNPGHVYPLARQYTIATNEYHTRPGDDALLSMGDVDMTAAAWVWLDATATLQHVLAKYNPAALGREYRIFFYNVDGLFYFQVRNMGDTVLTNVSASTFGAPSTGTWYLVIAYHDAIANEIGISINNGAVDTQAHATGILDGTSTFIVGGYQFAGSRWGGRIGPSALWKSAPGAGGALTAAQRTDLWNGGAGLTYAQLTT